MLDINEYLLKYKIKIPKILFIWIIFLTFIICGCLIINKTFKLTNYYKIHGVVNEKSVSAYINFNDLDRLVHNDLLYINNEKYSYKVDQISEDMIISDNSYYKEVLLNINLKGKDFINNNVIDIQIIIEEMTILEYIVNLIKGE